VYAKTLTGTAVPKTLEEMFRAWLVPLVILGVTATATTAHAKVRRETKAPKLRPPAAELYALNTRETFILRPDAKGRFGKAQLRGWNRFLRCHHTGRTHLMSSRLAALIYDIDKHFEFKRVFVVAGYRAPRVAKEKGNPKSPHKKGLACDFRVDGVSNTDLRDYERTLPRVGVGYYPNSDFVHLDVRDKKSAFWIDYSGPGERAMYSRTPEQDLSIERDVVAVDDEPTPPVPAGATADSILGRVPSTPAIPTAVAPAMVPGAGAAATPVSRPLVAPTASAAAGGPQPQAAAGKGAAAPNSLPPPPPSDRNN
jgi:uncharacterized protein YcbK (DUF882 family)